ncbi:UDP-N-acetylglucosamine 1-carboxyvinyltransferase [Prochlorococcus sp. SS52]|uniref:UDP-N-acetylglucosamine 1-carboxyvinyltransferase 2 n=1 Tax=Prochlorococcus marinus (strain SARG / CCMP1375 / SS120) TaxID=167539 RepID=MURA2_PROMA|nr:RecName: Full=UDP-N-acetylglucosamine 1-carboxyvinyltransferase 2; AltName: Full=Enoylpyruvate transferase 2; AltName: Full=UDP-N-acetylglucosamine enolpyruvyl transferase 2; Short=EPT 2 [Prochlorococcus marinus subsp. marinus str. CCMP1375]AAQ00583.1 UDP-N-acetylglucosamine enolpyruvyl transferase [Prochlorococcus marinus subsp. marinus str. CCMP1375]KGG10929.1 UDP-N-acetylglucosamine 1-carboxyvinyltransferase [Prochlorococcus marinus str. LG]KGG31564.1 UDP-N-acetylglucosamine 1-carboxyvinyl
MQVLESQKLSGHIRVSGAKNSSLVLMAAALLADRSVFLSNVPLLTDVEVMSKLLVSMGVELRRNKNQLEIMTSGLSLFSKDLSCEAFHSLRASFFCIGPLLARFGEAKIPLPGGCRIGARPIDEHIQALKALGARVEIQNDYVVAKAISPQKRLIGARIRFNCKSVGATETILMAATLSQGTTILENTAEEPEIQDLATMLNEMGAKIQGAGTSQITIEGVDRLKGCSYTVMPDRIEAGTFLVAAAITRSPLTISPVVPEHLEAVILKLQECGCLIEYSGNTLSVIPRKNLQAVDITTRPFPGFPTDLQAPFMALMTTVKGISKIQETVFENRMQHVGELQRMGATIVLEGNTAVVIGGNNLKATSVTGGDLRSCAAMVLASLAANGTSVIQGLEHLDRGYEDFAEKLNAVGANISRTHSVPLSSQE